MDVVMLRRRTGRRGAALLEVLVALAILTMAALPLLRLGRLGLRRSRAGAERLAAAQAVGAVATELAEGLRPVPAPGAAAEVTWDGRPCRVERRPAPLPGLEVAEVRCGGVRQTVVVPAEGGGR